MASSPERTTPSVELVAITRRDFVLRSTAVVATVCLGCVDSLTAPTLDSPVVITLANYPSLSQVGGMARVSDAGSGIALERTGTDTFVAFSLQCPHEGATVNVEGGSTVAFFCPRHGAEFNAAGANIGGQRTGSLTRFTTAYNAAAGTVTISS